MSKKKRQIPLIKVRINNGSSYSQLIDNPGIKNLVIETAVNAIADGITNNKDKTYIFEVADCEFYIELEKSNWKKTLETAMDYFVEKEDFDSCICCRDLITKI